MGLLQCQPDIAQPFLQVVKVVVGFPDILVQTEELRKPIQRFLDETSAGVPCLDAPIDKAGAVLIDGNINLFHALDGGLLYTTVQELGSVKDNLRDNVEVRSEILREALAPEENLGVEVCTVVHDEGFLLSSSGSDILDLHDRLNASGET